MSGRNRAQEDSAFWPRQLWQAGGGPASRALLLTKWRSAFGQNIQSSCGARRRSGL